MRSNKITVVVLYLFILGLFIFVKNRANAQDFRLTHKSASSSTIFAQSLSCADIQAAVDSASPDDTVILPFGTNSNFFGTVTITTDNLHIKGQGHTNTIIELGSYQDGRYNPIFDFVGTTGCKFSGIRLKGYKAYYPYIWSGCLRFDESTEFEIYDSYFHTSCYYGIMIRGYPAAGVIHNCTVTDSFIEGEGLGYGIAIYGVNRSAESLGDYGDASWEEDVHLGPDGRDYVTYIEDCTISDCRHQITGQLGARFVLRYCDILMNCTEEAEKSIDTHGYGPQGRGCRSYEVYENTGTRTDSGNINFFIFYAGDGVVYNNTITGLQEQAKWGYLGHGCCGGNYCGDYPLPDQVQNIYLWGNNVNGGSYNNILEVSRCEDEPDYPYFQQNRDWFDYPKPGYSPLIYPHPLRQETGPSIGLSKTSLEFNAMVGGSNPSNQTIKIANTGGGLLNWSVSDNVDWFVCTPNSGQEYAEITASANSSGLSVGTYTATITITSPHADNSPQHISVSLTIFPPTSKLNISSSTGASSPGNGGTTNPAPGVYSYSSGNNVQVTALNNPDYRFSHWRGDVNSSGTFNEEITVYMNADKTVSANFCTKCGDVTGDLSITPGDAQRVFDIYLGKGTNPTPCELENADVNCDGTKTEPYVTPGDAQAIFSKYLGLSEFPADCSGKSRSTSVASVSIQKRRAENINLIIDTPRAVSDEFIVIPIIIDNPYDLKAFGFDLHFPSGILYYVAMEETEFTERLDEVDANIVAQGILRIGGYSSVPVISRFPVLLTLIFKVVGKVKEPKPITIMNTVDDIKNSNIRIGTITKEINHSKHNGNLIIK